MVNFYVSASFPRKQEAKELAEEIQRTFGWISTALWLYQDVNGYELTGEEKENFLTNAAERDLSGVKQADILILMTGDKLSSGGKWTELGIALSDPNKVVIILGPKEGVFCYHKRIFNVERAGHLLLLLARMQEVGF